VTFRQRNTFVIYPIYNNKYIKNIKKQRMQDLSVDADVVEFERDDVVIICKYIQSVTLTVCHSYV